MNGLDYFKASYGLRDEDVLLFPYGSRVYGTHSENSDYDYLAVIPAGRQADTGTEYRHDNYNIHMYNRIDWQNQLNDHKIHTLEAYFLPDGICKGSFQFKLDLNVLRHELSEKSSHSFVKAKKKIEVEKDYYIGWKSLFHSLRILTFAIQIARDGGIVDYGAANHYWTEIRDAQQYKWDYFKQKYQPEYNRLASEFKKLAPKDMRYIPPKERK